MQFLVQAQPYLQDLKRGLTINTFFPSKKLANARRTEKKFKRNTENIPFIITHITLKYLFKKKIRRKKKNLLKCKK
jgi:hypothetical protein